MLSLLAEVRKQDTLSTCHSITLSELSRSGSSFLKRKTLADLGLCVYCTKTKQENSSAGINTLTVAKGFHKISQAL